MYVCLFPCNLTIGYFVLLLVEPMAGKSVSPSQLWQFLKNVFVAEKWLCKALLIGCYLAGNFFAFADISINI